MHILILAADRPDSLDRRLAIRQAHLDYWNALPGTVKVAGAMLSGEAADATPKGSCFVIEAESVAAARVLLADDPFMREGVFGDDVRFEVLRPAIGDWVKA